MIELQQVIRVCFLKTMQEVAANKYNCSLVGVAIEFGCAANYHTQ